MIPSANGRIGFGNLPGHPTGMGIAPDFSGNAIDVVVAGLATGFYAFNEWFWFFGIVMRNRFCSSFGVASRRRSASVFDYILKRYIFEGARLVGLCRTLP